MFTLKNSTVSIRDSKSKLMPISNSVTTRTHQCGKLSQNLMDDRNCSLLYNLALLQAECMVIQPYNPITNELILLFVYTIFTPPYTRPYRLPGSAVTFSVSKHCTDWLSPYSPATSSKSALTSLNSCKAVFALIRSFRSLSVMLAIS
jgi:hypothetical protein